jgi:hypothetical protein
MGEFVKQRCRPMKKWGVAVVDQWNDGAIVGTFATLTEAYEAIRQLGQDTCDGQWRYTFAPSRRPLLDPTGATSTSPIQR